MIFLEARNISKKFGAQVVLNNINLKINRGEMVCVLGPSGCGKTTLLRIIAGLETADAGEIFIGAKTAHSLRRQNGIMVLCFSHMS